MESQLSIKKPLVSIHQNQDNSEDTSLDQVREILFGKKAKSIDYQLSEVEHKFDKAVEANQKKLEALSIKLDEYQNTIEKLLARVTEKEQQSRVDLKAEILKIINLKNESIQSEVASSLKESKDRRSSLALALAEIASKLEDDS